MKMARKELHRNREVTLLVFVLALVCALLAAPALADYGYTDVSQIPMAVDFDYSVEYDSNGWAHVRTDYPYQNAGADEMTLLYRQKDGTDPVAHLTYDFSSKNTMISSYNSLFENEKAVSQAIRDGEIVLDRIYINTAHFNQKTDWFLVYDVNAQQYTSYAERTFAQSFDAMGAGGTEQVVYYSDDEITGSRTDKRQRDSDLIINYDETGGMQDAYINVYPDNTSYFYDPETGLFNGRTITELGYEESDLYMEAFAARGTHRTETVVVADPEVILPPARNTPSLAGGVLTGLLIGLTLFRMFRRRKEERKAEQEARKKESESTEAQESTYVEPAEMRTFSSGR